MAGDSATFVYNSLNLPCARRTLLLPALVLIPGSVRSQEPAYPHGTGPTVLIDTAHHNLFSPFENHAPRLKENGYRVRELTQPFDREALVDVQITLVIAPMASRKAFRAWRRPIPSAFTEKEVSVLRQWVAEGGALLIASDHFPIAGAVAELGTAFGIEISNGFAVDGDLLTEQTVAQAGRVVFERAEGGVAADPITNGRTPDERIDSFGFFVGSAFRLPPDGRSLLTFGSSFVSLLPEVAWEFSETRPRGQIGGWSGGRVLRVERGRLAIFGELGILATRQGSSEHRELQNPRLFMNTLHWLSGLLD